MTTQTAPETPAPAVAGASTEASSGGTTQRTDIQGLRALAVLAVVGAHVGLATITGGFVGVDVFFAISGFLITQQLVRGADRDGRVSLVGFYARRARRILPAATVVLVATCAYAAWQLGFVRTKSIVTDAVWSAGFAANIHFSRIGTDYFAQDLPPSPLQHFWSLAVEEQFYLLWPVVVLLCVALRRRLGRGGRRVRGQNRHWLIASVAVLTLASLVWSAHVTTVDPEGAYFSPFARAWELGLGALAALAIRDDNPQDGTARWRAQALSFAGVFLIVCACLQFNDATPFPGTPALVPVLGSVFILVAGSLWHGPTVVNRFLSLAPLRILGNWSYSLYLWHFPLLVLPAIKAGKDLPWGERMVLVLLAVALSGASYHLVEQPFRRPWVVRRRWRAVLLYPLSLALVVAAGVGANSYATSAVRDGKYHPAITVPTDPAAQAQLAAAEPSVTPSTAPTTAPAVDPTLELLRASVQAARRNQPIPSTLEPSLDHLGGDFADLGDCDYMAGSRRLCPRGDPAGTKTLVLFGNSHAEHWIPALDVIARRAGYRAYYLAMPGCIASLFTDEVSRSNESTKQCTALRSWAIRTIRSLKPDLLLVSASPVTGTVEKDGHQYRDTATVQRFSYQAYVDFLAAVTPSAARTVWLRDIPAIDHDPGTCLSSHRTLGPCLEHEDSWHRSAADVQMQAARARHVRTVDMDDWFCWQGECPDVVGSTLTHRDTNHMTTEYAATLAEPLGVKLGLW